LLAEIKRLQPIPCSSGNRESFLPEQGIRPIEQGIRRVERRRADPHAFRRDRGATVAASPAIVASFAIRVPSRLYCWVKDGRGRQSRATIVSMFGIHWSLFNGDLIRVCLPTSDRTF
jgi:hypothetical protein